MEIDKGSPGNQQLSVSLDHRMGRLYELHFKNPWDANTKHNMIVIQKANPPLTGIFKGKVAIKSKMNSRCLKNFVIYGLNLY
jgi:hypothetical protein